jgi:hypothetical protein
MCTLVIRGQAKQCQMRLGSMASLHVVLVAFGHSTEQKETQTRKSGLAGIH